MYLDTDFPPGVGRLAQFMRVVADFERDEIEAGVDGLIAFLDRLDGDSDVEPNGDEADAAVVEFHRRDPAYRAELRAAGITLEDAEAAGDEEDYTGAEDDFVEHRADGPGCPIADSDHGSDETGSGGDPSWAEWHTRGRHKLTGFGNEPTGGDHEDAEDDDPAEQDDEPEENGDREEVNEDGSESVYATRPVYGLDQSHGPLNEKEAQQAQMAAVYGLARSTSNPSGWRHRS